ncbi:hypothetical protein NBRC110019_09700 [Neptunitalea chrysea]|uniref:DinB-like domain-containing protein n=1 Tax=Neptunitalea chrysea TaxID=1647581 RepID=A0A9W6B3G9_9FLAO|nr:DinB family protein [Neptunitalea chrysea]GLB51931.1 hypothetical protein NBRC110019_09700 [Neptunitalea chrysea]
MSLSSKQLASRLSQVILNGTWIANTNYKDQLTNLDYKIAIYKYNNLNSIAELTFHISYYIEGILAYFNTGKLTIKDKHSFNLPKINNQDEWENLLTNFWKQTERLLSKIEELSESDFTKPFFNIAYGDYLRNINGLIEHAYYHLGQIVLIKKLISK